MPRTSRQWGPSPYSVYYAWKEGYSLHWIAQQYDYPVDVILKIALKGRKKYHKHLSRTRASQGIRTAVVNLYKYTDKGIPEIAEFVGISEERVIQYCELKGVSVGQKKASPSA